MPFWLRLVAATVLAQQNRELLAEISYLRAEVDYYRAMMMPGKRRRFTDEWRRRLAETGAALGWRALHAVATVAKASTIRQWHSLLKAGRLLRKRVGRPRTSPAVEAVVLRIARENHWGQIRICGELLKLGIVMCPRTVAAILKRNGLPSGPHRFRTGMWRPFITEHDHEIVATDFFTADVWSWLGKQTIYVLFAVHLGSRRAHIMGVTDHPNAAFMDQVARESTWDGSWMRQVGAKRIIYDKDTKYCASWGRIMEEGGIVRVPLPENSPNLNAFAERWVRTVKRECLRKVNILGVGGLRRALSDYVDHYNAERPHQGLGNLPPDIKCAVKSEETPPAQKIENVAVGDIGCRKRCGGAIRHYYRSAA